MKKIIKTLVYALAGCTILSLSNCQKKNINPKPVSPVDSNHVQVMYPLSQSKNDGTNTYVYKYAYDKDNNLVKYARTDNVVTCNVGTSQVDLNVNEYNSFKELVHVSTTSFLYNLVGLPDKPVNIYKTAPTQVTYTYIDKDVASGVSKTKPGGLWQFENNKDGLPLKSITADGGGFNYNYRYDNKGNLATAEFVRLSGVRVGEMYQRVTFTGFDDKPSPFSAIRYYWVASYPQGYTPEFALAYCKNNPKQIVTEIYDQLKNALVKYQQDDLTYVYNDKGYPTQITINTSYFTGLNTHYVTTYNYSYQ
ncbi:hypothetical protein [Mucilaginibacter gossypii]|uniref:YD repeat-containing protein n=1 Tax=Mucilaginibacter gossypii TaxID=551996 RepID=A0A1G8ACD4_9SPHI|nr:hypothetical protein [Mucilaginibacter gossypii]SDH18608.1 hypothetical protein SAMN05192573_107156 [Mucilaginibacter gossypii]